MSWYKTQAPSKVKGHKEFHSNFTIVTNDHLRPSLRVIHLEVRMFALHLTLFSGAHQLQEKVSGAHRANTAHYMQEKSVKLGDIFAEQLSISRSKPQPSSARKTRKYFIIWSEQPAQPSFRMKPFHNPLSPDSIGKHH